MKKSLLSVLAVAYAVSIQASDFKTLINNCWTFALGNASSMEADYTHGTEYFTYLCKAQSAGHSHSPIMPDFDDSQWQKVSLPHDWAVDLPFSAGASHSHGYKCIGWKYPENSVGWYRKHLEIPSSDKGRQISIEFEGIYRDSQIFCNGFYLGHETSGYISRVYDLTPYLHYGADNVITVRCDASVEEGWYYEGAGIYRNVYLHKAGPVKIRPYSIKIDAVRFSEGSDACKDEAVTMQYELSGSDVDSSKISRKIKILDADGQEVTKATERWSIDNPYLYTLNIKIFYEDQLSCEENVRFGIREIEFSPERGFLLNGTPVKLKGCNMHLDHAGVGTGVPDGLWRYRLNKLKEYGFNAVRCSHNCASPAMLDLCDELGILVIDENRQFGINREQLSQLKSMIDRDRNHPSVILWSVGNEEWSLEHSPSGMEIAHKMSEFVHSIDQSRPSTYGNSGGRELVKGVDVFGYNYIVQNPIDEYHEAFPSHCAVGTEETSGCGTRGHYCTIPERGWMMPLNRSDTAGRVNVIESGWKFYRDRPWTAGLFYWTGQDYRGEPNPMKWPATGSQFGILDYCCFPKDEAYYLKSVWTDEPSVHICGPCNGEVWVYSSCDEVRLYANGKSLGLKKMPDAGHLVWNVSKYESGRTTADTSSGGIRYRAIGYISGKIVVEDTYPRRCEVTSAIPDKHTLLPDGQDVVIIDISSPEKAIDISVDNAELLGWGNGDPAFRYIERPSGQLSAAGTPKSSSLSNAREFAMDNGIGVTGQNAMRIALFSGYAQVIIRSVADSTGTVVVHIGNEELKIPIETDSPHSQNDSSQVLE